MTCPGSQASALTMSPAFPCRVNSLLSSGRFSGCSGFCGLCCLLIARITFLVTSFSFIAGYKAVSEMHPAMQKSVAGEVERRSARGIDL